MIPHVEAQLAVWTSGMRLYSLHEKPQDRSHRRREPSCPTTTVSKASRKLTRQKWRSCSVPHSRGQPIRRSLAVMSCRICDCRHGGIHGERGHARGLAGLFACARVDSNHHGPNGPQGPQPDPPAVGRSSSVQIVCSMRVCGHIGRIVRSDFCQTFVTPRPASAQEALRRTQLAAPVRHGGHHSYRCKSRIASLQAGHPPKRSPLTIFVDRTVLTHNRPRRHTDTEGCDKCALPRRQSPLSLVSASCSIRIAGFVTVATRKMMAPRSASAPDCS
jgi:hypothetical protein